MKAYKDLDYKYFTYEMGLPTFPVNPNTGVPCIEKWQHLTLEESYDLPKNTGAYGVALSSTFLVIDVDLKHVKGHQSYLSLQSAIPPEVLSDTLVIKTRSGGWHFFFRKPSHIKIQKNPKKDGALLYPGIDFLSKGTFVYGCGSELVVPGKSGIYIPGYNYDELPLIEEIPFISHNFLKSIEENEVQIQTRAPEYINEEIEIERFKNYVQSQEKPRPGERNDTIYKMSCMGFDMGVNDIAVLSILEDWNKEFYEPLDKEEIEAAIHSARKTKQNVTGAKAIDFSVFTPVPDEIAEAQIRVPAKYSGTWTQIGDQIRPTYNNAVNFFFINHGDLWAWDVFDSDVLVTGIAPWRTGVYHAKYMEEIDWMRARHYFSAFENLDLPKNLFMEAVQGFASDIKLVHPIKDFLTSLEWDGIERFKNIVKTSAPKDEEYAHKVIKIFFLAAVYRIFNPGYKFDHIMVLAGKQGLRKSEFVQACGTIPHKCYAKEFMKIPQDEREMGLLVGAWWIELAEKAAVRGKNIDMDMVKAFITRKVDRYTPRYGRAARDYPRIATLVWTLNNTSEYLIDDENRRFLIIELSAPINDTYVKENISQLYAEVMDLYTKGIQPYQLVNEIKNHAAEIALANKEQDILISSIAEYVKDKDEVLIVDVINNVYGLDTSKSCQMRVAQCLKELNFVKKQINKHKVWIKDDIIKEEPD